MNEGFYDYSNLDTGNGCCLNCYDASPGCLCYNCKCSKCYWYSSPQEYDGIKGHCDKTDLLKEERKEEKKEEFRKQYIFEAKIEKEKSDKLEKENEHILKEINQKKEIPNYYTCQGCKREFITKEEYPIILNKIPVCNICKGKIRLTKKEEKEIWEKVS